MNYINGKAFMELQDAEKTYQARATAALSEYRHKMQDVTERSKKWKNEQEYIDNHQPELADKARGELKSARDAYVSAVKNTVSIMRQSLSRYLAEPLNADFQNKLKLYSDFGVPMCKSEVVAMLKLNDGCAFGLRALSKVLSTTGAAWRVDFKDVAQYEDDIEKLEMYALNPPLFTPDEYHHESVQLFAHERIPMTTADKKGTYLSGSEYDSLSLILDRAAHKTATETIAAMQQSWTADVSSASISAASEKLKKEQLAQNEALRNYGIPEEYIDKVPDDAESTTHVQESESEALRIARELGQRDADAAAAYEKGMAVYKK